MAEIKQNEEQKKEKEKYRKKLAIAIGVTFILIVVIVAAIIIINPQPKSNEFTYSGFVFREIDFGGLDLYQTNMDLVKEGKHYDYNLTFRNDPRILEYIPVDFSGITKGAYISFAPNTTECKGNATMAVFELGQFLSVIGIESRAAVTENFTGNTLPVRNCSNSISSTVVILKPFSNETRIYQEEGKNCIILESKECYLVEVSERFILALLQKYKKS